MNCSVWSAFMYMHCLLFLKFINFSQPHLAWDKQPDKCINCTCGICLWPLVWRGPPLLLWKKTWFFRPQQWGLLVWNLGDRFLFPERQEHKNIYGDTLTYAYASPGRLKCLSWSEMHFDVTITEHYQDVVPYFHPSCAICDANAITLLCTNVTQFQA
jgi:hypothetical protein